MDEFVILHIAKTLHTEHKTLVGRMSNADIKVAFDGLILNI